MMLLGVNVHDELTAASPYANSFAVASALLKLRPKIVRGISPQNLDGMRWLASHGIGYIIMLRTDPAHTDAPLYAPGVRIAKDAGVLVVLEGYNEPDIHKPTSATYTDWVSYTKASQAAVWDVGQKLGVMVLGPSVVFREGAAQLGPVPMDYLNVHTYGNPHTSVADVAGAISMVRYLAPAAGVWVTECGSSTCRKGAWWWPFGGYDVTEAQAADLTIAARDRAQALGVEAFIVYELVDQRNIGGWNAPYEYEANFGCFRADWSAKPVVARLGGAQ